jgi:hypothetical protein
LLLNSHDQTIKVKTDNLNQVPPENNIIGLKYDIWCLGKLLYDLCLASLPNQGQIIIFESLTDMGFSRQLNDLYLR